MIDIIHKYSLSIVYNFADFIYRKKFWLNKKFKSYINEINPNIFFSFLTKVAILYPIVKYLKKNTSSKVVLYVADDVYDVCKKKNIFIRKRF